MFVRTVMEEVSNMVRRGGVWEMLYANDFVLTGESKQEVEQMFVRWKETMERRDLKVNMIKSKLMDSGASDTTPVQMGRYPCGVCRRSAGVNSKLCTCSGKWCHKRYSGLCSLNSTQDFVCPGALQDHKTLLNSPYTWTEKWRRWSTASVTCVM